jgi:hypothetical protein
MKGAAPQNIAGAGARGGALRRLLAGSGSVPAATAKGCSMTSCGSGLAAFSGLSRCGSLRRGAVTGELGSASNPLIVVKWRSGISRPLGLSLNHWLTHGRLTPQTQATSVSVNPRTASASRRRVFAVLASILRRLRPLLMRKQA